MTTPEIIALTVVLLIAAGALLYILFAKKKGKRCIGCPYECACSGKGCSCGEDSKNGEKQ